MVVKGVDVHKCPNCGCQVEKDGGCPEMNCGVCHYSWCWTCGLKSDSTFHHFIIPCCVFINAFVFGFEMDIRIHWFFRLILCLILLPILIIIGYLAVIVYSFIGPLYLVTELLPYRRLGRKVGKCIAFLILLPFNLALSAIGIGLALGLGTLLYAIVLVIGTIAMVIILFRLVY